MTVPKVDSTPLQPCRLEEEDDSPSPLRGAEGIVDEEIPEQMIEQCNEALTDEVRKLQVGAALFIFDFLASWFA